MEIDKLLEHFIKFARKNAQEGTDYYPYMFEKDPTSGDVFVRHAHFDKISLSINDKNLVAMHDIENKFNELWHWEKERYTDNGNMAEEVLRSFLFSFLRDFSAGELEQHN